MRLDKYLTEAAVGRRKEVIGLIKRGAVCVNGTVIFEPSFMVDESGDEISFQNEIVTHSGREYYMFHKPAGCISARSDDNHKTVFAYLEEIHNNGLFPVGRLDKDTEGLLFITNDGDFNHNLMFPQKAVEKTYFFWALGTLGEKEIVLFEQGISLGMDEKITKPAKLEVISTGGYHTFQDEIESLRVTEKKGTGRDVLVVSGKVTVVEGRKHQVKRMLKAVGCYVIYLKRISVGGVFLDETLKKGEVRKLTEEEVALLMQT